MGWSVGDTYPTQYRACDVPISVGDKIVIQDVNTNNTATFTIIDGQVGLLMLKCDSISSGFEFRITGCNNPITKV
jgi:hypothetical protein